MKIWNHMMMRYPNPMVSVRGDICTWHDDVIKTLNCQALHGADNPRVSRQSWLPHLLSCLESWRRKLPLPHFCILQIENFMICFFLSDIFRKITFYWERKARQACQLSIANCLHKSQYYNITCIVHIIIYNDFFPPIIGVLHFSPYKLQPIL